MLNFINRSVLRDGEPGAAGGGTGATGSQTGTPGTGSLDPSKFVSVEDFGKTAAMIRGLQKTIENLSTGALTADKLAELGLLEKGDDGSFKPRSAAPGDKKPAPPADDPLKKELDALKKQLADKDAEVESERRKVEETERNRAVIAAMSKAGAVNADRDFVHLAGKVVKSEKGGYVVKGADKYGSEIEIPLEQFTGSWLKENPELLRAQAGSGTGSRPGQGGQQGGNVIPKEVWKDPAWYQANRAKVISGELQLGQ